MSTTRKIIEVARMDVHSLCRENFEGKFFIRARRRNAYHRVPSAFYFPSAARFLPRELVVKLGKVFFDARHQLPLELLPLGQ